MKKELIEILKNMEVNRVDACSQCTCMAVDCEKCPFYSPENMKAIIEELEATK